MIPTLGKPSSSSSTQKHWDRACQIRGVLEVGLKCHCWDTTSIYWYTVYIGYIYILDIYIYIGYIYILDIYIYWIYIYWIYIYIYIYIYSILYIYWIFGSSSILCNAKYLRYLRAISNGSGLLRLPPSTYSHLQYRWQLSLQLPAPSRVLQVGSQIDAANSRSPRVSWVGT